MAFLNLDVEIDYDFRVIAISSNQRAHTVCWKINVELNSRLSLSNNFQLNSRGKISEFKKFTSSDDKFFFHLICNKSSNQRLVKELPTVDYLIKVYDEDCPISHEEMLSSLRKLKCIQAVYSLDVEKLKSKQVFIFD